MGSASRSRRVRRAARPPGELVDSVMCTLAARYDIDRFRRTHGPGGAFRVLIGCIISLRTKDEVTYPATERLFHAARDARSMQGLDASEIAGRIFPAGFYRRKAAQIREISRILVERYDGRVPSDIEALLELPGVGRKTANLVVTLGFDRPGICVDVHVHRISNRLGWVRTAHPDDTERELRGWLASRHWIPINETLVRHGQQVCKPVSPICSACAIRPSCRRVGVERSR